MGKIFRVLVGKASNTGLALLVIGAIFIAWSGTALFELDQVFMFYKVMFTLVAFVFFLNMMLVCSLTLGTRYFIAGLIGIATEVFCLIVAVGSIWAEKSSTPEAKPTKSITSSPTDDLLGDLGADPTGAIGTDIISTPPDATSQIFTTFIIIVILIAAALPLINLVLFSGFNRGPIIEVGAGLTVVLIIAGFSFAAVTTVIGEWTQGGTSFVSTLAILAVGGIIGVPVAAGTRFAKEPPKRRYTGRTIYQQPNGEVKKQSPTMVQPPPFENGGDRLHSPYSEG